MSKEWDIDGLKHDVQVTKDEQQAMIDEIVDTDVGADTSRVPSLCLLSLYWDSIGTRLGLYWETIGTVVGLCWDCVWDCVGTVLGLYGDCIGTA